MSSGASGKEPVCQCRRHKRLRFDPWVRKTPWRRRAWQPTPVFLPGNPMDRGAWWAMVHRVAKSWTRLKPLSMQYASTQEKHAGIQSKATEGRPRKSVQLKIAILLFPGRQYMFSIDVILIIHICIYVCIYIQIYIHTHTHIPCPLSIYSSFL